MSRIVFLVPSVVLALASTTSFAATGITASCDFDGDDYQDLAVGVPGESIGGVPSAGLVNVLYGGPSGLLVNDNQIFSQETSGVNGTEEAGDGFGSAVACGDFDGDGFSDLAVGIPYEDNGYIVDAGSVAILYGGPGGLHTVGDQVFWESQVGGATVRTNAFGAALAAGDLNGDGSDDLAIGIPGADVSGNFDAGAVGILYGTPNGLSWSGADLLNRNTWQVAGVAGSRDRFGSTLAIGLLNDDGFADLVVGAPGDRHASGTVRAGSVQVFFGELGGVELATDFLLTQGGVSADASEAHDDFGAALAIGDFDGNERPDLAVGVPGEDVGGVANGGAVHVFYSDDFGPNAADDQFLHQDVPGIRDTFGAQERFGAALAAGDFNYDGEVDLAIGVPGHTIVNDIAAGAVHVINGRWPNGLTTIGDQMWHADSSGVHDSAEPSDGFGTTLAVGDFNFDNRPDLAIGVPGEGYGSTVARGAVQTLYAGAYGLNAQNNQTWHQNRWGVLGSAEAHDRFAGGAASDGVYRLPFADGNTIAVGADSHSHGSLWGPVDINAVLNQGAPRAVVVAADDGVIQVIQDSRNGTTANNYVWISHANGEWTKYSHMSLASTSIQYGLSVGDAVNAGDPIGLEDDVGLASGDHVHFEVLVPDVAGATVTNGTTGQIPGEIRRPVFCGITGGQVVMRETYTSAPCP